MSTNLSAIFYLISGVLFILALRGLSSPETSRQGNYLGMTGMIIAILVTFFSIGNFSTGLIFVLSIFIGYYVVWSVTPSLHTPLMSVTNAISSVIIVGAIVAASSLTSHTDFNLSNILGFAAIILAAINIFGGFLVTQRMLQMYKKKKKGKVK